ncbi:hypothetical protein V6N13_129903 [Hibiscus sabdariffa]
MDSLQSENTMAGEHSCDLSKVKPESVGNIPRVGSKSSFKHLNDDYKSSNSTGSLKYEKLVPGVMQLNNRTGSLYAEAKQSFTNTENNDESDERSFLAWLWSFALEETCMLSDKDNLEGTFQSKLPASSSFSSFAAKSSLQLWGDVVGDHMLQKMCCS